MKYLKSFSAFTLAEVLIVLGIIGVVAELTIPDLIANTQKMEIITAWKNDFSIINQAIMQMSNDNNGSLPWSYNANQGQSGCIETFAKYLKFTKTCNGNESGCFDFATSSIGPYYTSAIMANGTSLAFESGGVVYVDVNGYLKPPNKTGTDIFSIRFSLSNGAVWPYGATNINESTTDAAVSVPCDQNSTDAWTRLTCSNYFLTAK